MNKAELEKLAKVLTPAEIGEIKAKQEAMATSQFLKKISRPDVRKAARMAAEGLAVLDRYCLTVSDYSMDQMGRAIEVELEEPLEDKAWIKFD